ncbi:MAG: HEAT repeat domain-containing protein, partial [Coleofasciculaceae cyanobacterium SM2_1_6]|nr:HEAT repeat domain-containing protein [Coleofasciculaceae cyanobacterium SM2_1_6]
ATASLGKIGKDNLVVIDTLVELTRTAEDEYTRRCAAESLGSLDKNNPVAIDTLVELSRTAKDEFNRMRAANNLGEIDKHNPVVIAALVELTLNAQDEETRLQAAESLGRINKDNSKDNSVVIAVLVELARAAKDKRIQVNAVCSLGEIGKDNLVVIAALVELTRTAEYKYTRRAAMESLGRILTTPEQYAGVVSTLKDGLSNEVYQNNFDLCQNCYQVLWQCAENLPYPEFYQAWHSHPEVPDQTPVGHNSTVANLETQKIDICEELQNLPIFCLKAHILAAETRESEIAATLCQLIWDKALPDAEYPEAVTTPSDLRKHLKQLQRNQQLPKLAILLTDCEHATPELITFCYKLTNILSIAWLTDQPLEAPLKGFPPDQPNLLSAIQTWLEET